MSAPTISSAAMLVKFGVTIPTFRKGDRTATEEVATNNRADKMRFNLTKSLINNDEFKALKTHVGDVRNNVYYARTLPWEDKGPRLLTNEMYPEFHEKITYAIDQGKDLWDIFLGTYEYQRDVVAPRELGDLYDPLQYPSLTDLQSEGFRMNLGYSGIAEAGDFRNDIGVEGQNYIRSQMQSSNEERLKGAMQDLWTQLHDQIQKFITNLSVDETTGKKGKISDGIFDRLVALTDMLHTCNITSDPQMDAMRRKLSVTLDTVSTDAIRNSPTVRENTRNKLTEALNSLPSLNM
jgi:hypothetical protein